MTATNHALTGAAIGLLIGDPWIALPAAFLSHFVCDAIPHFANDGDNANRWISSPIFKKIVILDAILCIIFVAVLAVLHPHHWFQASVCAFLATSPDLFWINRFLKVRQGKPWKPNLYSKFAYRIQWFQRPIGAIVELTWFICGVYALSILLP